jgi:hypothetical protein
VIHVGYTQLWSFVDVGKEKTTKKESRMLSIWACGGAWKSKNEAFLLGLILT